MANADCSCKAFDDHRTLEHKPTVNLRLRISLNPTLPLTSKLQTLNPGAVLGVRNSVGEASGEEDLCLKHMGSSGAGSKEGKSGHIM